MSAVSIAVTVIAGLFIFATIVGLPTHRWQIACKRAAIVVAAVGVAFGVARGFLFGRGEFVFAGLWLFNCAVAFMSLRLTERTHRRYSRI